VWKFKELIYLKDLQENYDLAQARSKVDTTMASHATRVMELLSNALLIGLRGLTSRLLEVFGEVRRILEAEIIGDFFHRKVRLIQQIFGFLNYSIS
jgi:hypothetical protein